MSSSQNQNFKSVNSLHIVKLRGVKWKLIFQPFITFIYNISISSLMGHYV